jgi:hypothetical protein
MKSHTLCHCDRSQDALRNVAPVRPYDKSHFPSCARCVVLTSLRLVKVSSKTYKGRAVLVV